MKITVKIRDVESQEIYFVQIFTNIMPVRKYTFNLLEPCTEGYLCTLRVQTPARPVASLSKVLLVVYLFAQTFVYIHYNLHRLKLGMFYCSRTGGSRALRSTIMSFLTSRLQCINKMLYVFIRYETNLGIYTSEQRRPSLPATILNMNDTSKMLTN